MGGRLGWSGGAQKPVGVWKAGPQRSLGFQGEMRKPGQQGKLSIKLNLFI